MWGKPVVDRTAGVLVAAALVASLAGCGSAEPSQTGQPAPSDQPGQAEGAPEAPPDRRIYVVRGSDLQWVTSGVPISVGTSGTTLGFRLTPGLTEDQVRTTLRVSGVKVGRLQWWPNDGTLHLDLAAPRAGERGEIRVLGLAPKGGDLRVGLWIVENPLVAVTARAGGGVWQPLGPWTLPPGPLEFRFAFSKSMNRPSVEAALPKGTFTWEDDRTLLWWPSQAPHELALNLREARDSDGLVVDVTLPRVRVGAPATLVSLDPARPREETPVADLPPEIAGAWVSADGRWLGFCRWRYDGADQKAWPWRLHRLLLDLQHGKASEVAPGELRRSDLGAPDTILWDTLAEVSDPGGPWDLWRTALSPDGTRVADWYAPGGVAGSGVLQAALVITDLRSGRKREFQRAFGHYAAAKDGDQSHYLAWSPDGTEVGVLDVTGPDAVNLVAIDAASGQKRVLHKELALGPGWAVSAGWSPDGRHIRVGAGVYEAATGKLRVSLGENPHGPPTSFRWSPDSRWLLYNEAEWGALYVMNVNTGERLAVGEGLPAGWSRDGRAYLIRWPTKEDRYRPPTP